MEQHISCVMESYLYEHLSRDLEVWGWKSTLIQSSSQCANQEQFLSTADDWIDNWACNVLQQLKGASNTLLLIQAELTAHHRSFGYGVLLAERIWCEQVVPTVIATIDPYIAKRSAVKRLESPLKQPIVSLVYADNISSCRKAAIVLWDFLSGQYGLQKAVTAAFSLVNGDASPHAITKMLKWTALEEKIASEISNKIHKLKGLLAPINGKSGRLLKYLDSPNANTWESLYSLITYAFIDNLSVKLEIINLVESLTKYVHELGFEVEEVYPELCQIRELLDELSICISNLSQPYILVCEVQAMDLFSFFSELNRLILSMGYRGYKPLGVRV